MVDTTINLAEALRGITFEKNVRIPTGDSYVMANVFRPQTDDPVPALLAVSPYGKDLHTKDGFPEIWQEMLDHLPNIDEHSTLSLHTWETNDPEIWVPNGYACVRLDVPGAGKSPGKLDCYSPIESQATYDAIEWAAAQPWCNGKVALMGISYLAIIQWRVASQQPPHLTAICPWEGEFDYYREWARHGGILSNTFSELWWPTQVLALQHGDADGPHRDFDDGAPMGGPDALSRDELAANRIDLIQEFRDRELDGQWYRDRSGDYDKITVPILSAANWGGQGLHARGNFEGFTQSASTEKWLRVHGGNHRDAFYLPDGEALQKQFFDYYLRGQDNGWPDRAPVMLKVRQIDDSYVERDEQEWPLARTQWTKFHLDLEAGALRSEPPAQSTARSYPGLGRGLSFRTDPFPEQTEITGPVAAKLWVSSSTEDMDIFATLRAFAPDGTEATFAGSVEPQGPVTQGWLRVSHRKLDSTRSTEWRPWHTHDTLEKMTPNEIYEVRVEIWPTSLVIPAGYTLELLIEGKDFARDEMEQDPTYTQLVERMSAFAGGADWSDLFRGCGLFLHNDPTDRPAEVFGGDNTLHAGGEHDAWIMLPIIPQP